MTTSADFTPEEWKTVVQAPLAASLYITLASPSLFGSFSEVMSATNSLVKGAQNLGGNSLQNAILGEFTEMDKAKAAQPKIESRDPAGAKTEVLTLIKSAVALIDAKGTPEEALEVRRWLYGIADATSQASKEGGFLGIGAVRVSEAEKAALAELAEALDVNAA